MAVRFQSFTCRPASFPVRLRSVGFLGRSTWLATVGSGRAAAGAGGLLPAALCLRRSRYLHSSVHVCLCFAGVVSGMLWNAGNIASIYAVQPPLGFAVGYPVTQVCGLLLRCGYTLLVVHASLYYH